LRQFSAGGENEGFPAADGAGPAPLPANAPGPPRGIGWGRRNSKQRVAFGAPSRAARRAALLFFLDSSVGLVHDPVRRGRA